MVTAYQQGSILECKSAIVLVRKPVVNSIVKNPEYNGFTYRCRLTRNSSVEIFKELEEKFWQVNADHVLRSVGDKLKGDDILLLIKPKKKVKTQKVSAVSSTHSSGGFVTKDHSIAKLRKGFHNIPQLLNLIDSHKPPSLK